MVRSRPERGVPPAGPLEVSRQERECPSLERCDGSKGTPVEGEQPAHPEPLSERDHEASASLLE